jgi:hypothetical protein
MSSTTDSPSTEPTCPVCELPWCACTDLAEARELGYLNGFTDAINAVQLLTAKPRKK